MCTADPVDALYQQAVNFCHGYLVGAYNYYEAARIRLRPILMTALAFIIGLMPLVIASGAGANARRSLGTTVVGGLTVATILIIFVPIFYYAIERLRERITPQQTEVYSPKVGQAATDLDIKT